MKIDYQQGFGAIQKLINSRAQAAYQATEKLAVEKPQDTEFKAQLSSQPMGGRALILPPPPALMAPDLGQPPPPPITPESVNDESLSVKAPTVLSVERVPNTPNTQVSLATDQLGTDEVNTLSKLISDIGVDNGIDPDLGLAVAKAESSMNPKAVSADGMASKGLFQLLDRTGAELHEQSGEAGQYNPFEPKLNANLGLRYLRKLHEYFSAPTEIAGVGKTVAAANSASLEKLAVAAFNAGEGRVTSAQSRAFKHGLDPSRYEQVERFLPNTTQSYVTKVMQFKAAIGKQSRTENGIS